MTISALALRLQIPFQRANLREKGGATRAYPHNAWSKTYPIDTVIMMFYSLQTTTSTIRTPLMRRPW